MSKEQTSNSGAIRLFLGLVAGGFVSAAIADIRQGQFSEQTAGALVVGAVVTYISIKWERISAWLGPRFTQSATEVATNFRWWLAALFVLFIYLGAPGFIGAVLSSIHNNTLSKRISVSETDVARTGDKARGIGCPPLPTPSRQPE
jgi:hypothetical protein